MKTKIIATIIGLLIAQFSIAQDSTELTLPKFKHGLGAAAGFTTGYGLSYRYHLPKYRFQVTFAPIIDENSTDISLGLTAMYNLIDANKTTLYLYLGNHYLYNKYSWYDYTTQGYDDEHIDTDIYHGIGFGIEGKIWERLSVNLMGGYAVKNYSQVHLTIEGGIFYLF